MHKIFLFATSTLTQWIKTFCPRIAFLVFHGFLHNKENITWQYLWIRILIFLYSSQYLSHLLHSLMRHRLEHLKIKFVSTHSIGKKPYCNNCLSRQRYYVYDGTVTGFMLFWAFQWPFPRHFRVFYDLKFSCHFENCQNHPCFRVFSDIICMFFILPSFGTCNNLRTTHIITSHDFPWPTIIFHDFPGLETEILKFHDPYEPCLYHMTIRKLRSSRLTGARVIGSQPSRN